MKKKTRNSPNRISPARVPDSPWLHDDPDAIPFLIPKRNWTSWWEGFIAGNRDFPAWIDLLQKVGFNEAKQILRGRFINKDPNINRERIH